jgi:hypothetical protein
VTNEAIKTTPGHERATPLRLGAVLAVAVVVGFAAWLVFIRDDDSEPSGPNSKAATLTDLQEVASQVGHTVYWVGPRAATTYELTRNDRGDVFIRYLPSGVPVADPRPNYVTVGTYPFRRAYATLQASARRPGTTSGPLPNRGVYVVNRERPNSVYLAYRGQDLQVEIFAPSSKRARQLVTSRRVQPVG